jgi:hypothetical protein
MFLGQFRRNIRRWVHQYYDRKYILNNTIISWNKHRRSGQDNKKSCLVEFKQEYGYRKLSVESGVIRYRRSNKELLFKPGDTIHIIPSKKTGKFKRYVDTCKGWASTQGTVIGINSSHNIPKQNVKKQLNNCGLVVNNIF